MNSLKERETTLNALYKDEPRVRITTYSGLTYNFCQGLSAPYIIRGLRNAQDFNYEQAIAQPICKWEVLRQFFYQQNLT